MKPLRTTPGSGRLTARLAGSAAAARAAAARAVGSVTAARAEAATVAGWAAVARAVAAVAAGWAVEARAVVGRRRACDGRQGLRLDEVETNLRDDVSGV